MAAQPAQANGAARPAGCRNGPSARSVAARLPGVELPGGLAITRDLDALAGRPNPGATRGRPAAGQQGAGQASQATGPQITAIFNQVYPNWILPCDIPGADQLRI